MLVPQNRLGRIHRRLLRVGVVITVVLSLIGAASTWIFFAAPPGVGYFRTAQGRAAYIDAYDEAFRLLPQSTTQRDLATAYGTVRVYEWSTLQTADATPIVLLPGRASGVPMWSTNLRDFIHERRVIAFDLLGDAGLSVQGVPFRSFDEQAAWVDEIVAQVAPGGADVVGHSFGAAVASSYSRQHPDRVLTLTLLEPVFTFSLPPAGLFGWIVISTLPGLPERAREHALGKIGGSRYDATDPVVRMIGAGTEEYRASLPQPHLLTAEQRAQLTKPVYVAIGDHDSLAGGSAAVVSAETLPNVTVKVWPNTTHSLPMQAGTELNRTLLDFYAAHHR